MQNSALPLENAEFDQSRSPFAPIEKVVVMVPTAVDGWKVAYVTPTEVEYCSVMPFIVTNSCPFWRLYVFAAVQDVVKPPFDPK